MLSEEQKNALCELLGRALIKIRELGWGGKAEQAADLADAVHGLPYDLLHNDVSLERLKSNLETYHRKYPPSEKGAYSDFFTLAERIQNNVS